MDDSIEYALKQNSLTFHCKGAMFLRGEVCYEHNRNRSCRLIRKEWRIMIELSQNPRNSHCSPNKEASDKNSQHHLVRSKMTPLNKWIKQLKKKLLPWWSTTSFLMASWQRSTHYHAHSQHVASKHLHFEILQDIWTNKYHDLIICRYLDIHEAFAFVSKDERRKESETHSWNYIFLGYDYNDNIGYRAIDGGTLRPDTLFNIWMLCSVSQQWTK